MGTTSSTREWRERREERDRGRGGSCCVRLGTKAEKMPIYELACCRTHGNHIFWSYLWTIKPESLCACQWVVSWHLFRLFLPRVQHAAQRGWSGGLRGMLRADGKYFSVHLMSNLRWARNFWSNKRAQDRSSLPCSLPPLPLSLYKGNPYVFVLVAG